jgi:hypothetical protein
MEKRAVISLEKQLIGLPDQWKDRDECVADLCANTRIADIERV